MLHVESVCTPRCMLLGVVAQSLKPVKLLATFKRTQQLPTLLGLTVHVTPYSWCIVNTRMLKSRLVKGTLSP